MRLIKLKIIALLAFMLIGLFSLPVYARDINGVTVTDFRIGKSAFGQHIDHFTNFNPTSTSYVYNEAGESTLTAGEIPITGNTGPKTLIISVPTLGSTSIDFRIEGKVGITMSSWADIFTKNVGTSTPTGENISLPITEYITAYRLGVKVNTNGTDVVNCSTTLITRQ